MKTKRINLLEKAKYLATIQGQYDDAISIVNKLLCINNEDIDALRLKGNILELRSFAIKQKNCTNDILDDPKIYYYKILQLDSDNTLALIDLGDYWQVKGKLELVLKFYNKAIDLLKKGHFYLSHKDEIEEAYWGKSEVLMKMNEKDESLKCKVEGLRWYPDSELLRP